MSLDSRAARATRSLRASVGELAPVGLPTVVRRHRFSMFSSFAAAAALVLAFVGIASAMPSFFEPDQVVGDGSQVPDSEGPLVVEPDDKNEEGQLVDLDEKGIEAQVRQQNSVSDSPEPWTKFYGHAEPGTAVSAESDWGGADLVVGDGGEFSLKLIFDSLPPAGLEFPILVMLGDDAYEFHFTSLWSADEIAVTAHQMYGVSDDLEAYEKFFGTAPPGTSVVATSPYGTADATTGDHGEWNLKLWFSELPFDDPFAILVEVGDEEFEFHFVSLYEPDVVPVSIWQGNTSSDSPSPYAKFGGTAPAGSHILAQSEYGSADVNVGQSGEFGLKLWFSTLPPSGDQFSIGVYVDGDFYGTYHFTSWYAPDEGGGDDGGQQGGEVFVDQYNTASESAEPWVKFIVGAPVGTQVQIISEYGSTSRTLESAEEYVKLWFSTLPPAGVEFPVTVKINGETHGTYPFTSWFDPEEEVSISVSQHNTESDGPEPWVKFNVTGPAGTQVQILSEYGSTSRTLESTNEYVKLWFSTLPPAGVEFPVTVKINGDVWGTYPFTSWFEEGGGEVDKTANATYGSCSEDPPYDIYYGTAPEGTTVNITSEYGSASTTANGSGEWSKQVFFEGAPVGEPFTVTVDVGGAIFTFQMTVTA